MPLNRLRKEQKALKDLEGATILIAIYDTPCYEGYAFVLYEKDGELFEVNGSHCSCYGLEGQWEPSKTNWKALDMREYWSFYDEPGLVESIKEYIKENL